MSESHWDNLYANAIGGSFSSKSNDHATHIQAESQKNSNSNGNDAEKIDEKDPSKSSQPSAYFLIYVKADDFNLYEGK